MLKRILRFHSRCEVVRIVLLPISAEDIGKTCAECLVLPAFDATTYRAKCQERSFYQVLWCSPSIWGGCKNHWFPGWRIRKRSA